MHVSLYLFDSIHMGLLCVYGQDCFDSFDLVFINQCTDQINCILINYRRFARLPANNDKTQFKRSEKEVRWIDNWTRYGRTIDKVGSGMLLEIRLVTLTIIGIICFTYLKPKNARCVNLSFSLCSRKQTTLICQMPQEK